MTYRCKMLCWVALFILSLLYIPATLGQDDDPRDVVLQAMAKLADGYHYTLDWSLEQQFIGEDEDDSFAIYTTQLFEGDVAASGDYHVTLTVRAGETPETFGDSPTVEVEHLQIGDQLYLNLVDVDEIFGNMIEDIEPGWYRVDDLLAQFEELTPERIILQNLANIVLPAELPLTDDLIVVVREEEPTTVDGTEMRVFTVEVDALQILVNQMPANGVDSPLEIMKSIRFLQQSELSLVYTVWIGADDGLLYQGESVWRNFLPYLTEDEPGPPYDMEMVGMSTFAISQHGAIDAIELPEGVQLRG